jgi:hypothetical protein
MPVQILGEWLGARGTSGVRLRRRSHRFGWDCEGSVVRARWCVRRWPRPPSRPHRTPKAIPPKAVAPSSQPHSRRFPTLDRHSPFFDET